MGTSEKDIVAILIENLEKLKLELISKRIGAEVEKLAVQGETLQGKEVTRLMELKAQIRAMNKRIKIIGDVVIPNLKAGKLEDILDDNK